MTGKPLVGYSEARAPKKPRPRKGVKKINAKRGGHRFPNNVNEPLREYVRGLPCILTGRKSMAYGLPHICRGDVVCCHLKTRGSGAPDDENVWPGCVDAHNEQEGRTKEFEWNWQLKLKPICRKVTAMFYGAAKHG